MPDSDVPSTPARRPIYEHPWAVRFAHWVNAVTVTVLTMSGLQIFTAVPSFGAKVPQENLIDMMPPSVTLGGWLGGALQWHFTFMWLFMGAGLLYAISQIASGHYRSMLFTPRDVPNVWPMARHYFLFGPKPPATQQYNALQKLAYTSAVALGAVRRCSSARFPPRPPRSPARSAPSSMPPRSTRGPKSTACSTTRCGRPRSRSRRSPSRSPTWASRPASAPKCASSTTRAPSASPCTPTSWRRSAGGGGGRGGGSGSRPACPPRRRGRRHRDAARFGSAVRRRQLPGHPRHLQGLAAGGLRGLENLSLGWDLKLEPFVVAGPRYRETSAANRSTTWTRDVGLDARYGVTAGLNLDVTLNTDFAQVEVDDQQVNLTRSGLFFPAVLDVQTDSAFSRPGDNFFVSRYSRDVLRRSSPGRRFFQRVTFQPNQFYGGTRRSLSYGIGARASSQLSAELNYNRNDVKMPWGDFLVNLTSLRVGYTFSPRMTIRLHQTGLPGDVFPQEDRQLAVKFNYLIQK